MAVSGRFRCDGEIEAEPRCSINVSPHFSAANGESRLYVRQYFVALDRECSTDCKSTPPRADRRPPRIDAPSTHVRSPRGKNCGLSSKGFGGAFAVVLFEIDRPLKGDGGW